MNNEPVADDTPEESFADLFEKTYRKPTRLEPGQLVEAVIVKIGPEWLFIDLGGKGEGYLERKDFLDADGQLTVTVGQKVSVYFVSSENNEMRFTAKIGTGPDKANQIEDAWKNELTVDGTVSKEMKGGFEIKIAGSIRAFCPFSQMGIRRDEQQADYVGRSLQFKIIEYREDGRNIILSRKPILELEKQKKMEALKSQLTEGMKVTGKVTSLQKFGAFVDIGGIEGLLPVSELAWTRTNNVSDVLSLGQTVEVIIKSLDWNANRFSFSLKDALPDPWETVEAAYPVGSSHMGTINRLAPFGAFVALKEGVDGLIHISKLGGGRKLNHPREVVKEGQTVEVEIEAIDKQARRLSLALAAVRRAEQEEASSMSDYRQQIAAEPQSFGTLADLLKKGMSDTNSAQ